MVLASMRSLAPLLLSALFLSFLGCDSGPGPGSSVASFTVSPQGPREDPRAGTAVDFTADATGQIETYKWNFGDGETATGPNPTHTFEERGTFSVSLTVTDDRGDTSTTTEPVTVQPRFTKATVTEVVIRDMPFTNDKGKGWDTSTGPDFYYRGHEPDYDELEKSHTIDNVEPADLPLKPTHPLDFAEFTLSDPTKEHEILLWDEDTSSNDDLISDITFSLDDQIGDYPDTVTLDLPRITIDMSIKWKQ